MDRGIAQVVGDLRKIHLAGTDQFLRLPDFHLIKIFDYTAVCLFPKQLFKLRIADQIVLADLFHG